MHVIGRREEAGVPGEKPGMHGENMVSPHRKALAGIQTRNPLAIPSANQQATVQPNDKHLLRKANHCKGRRSIDINLKCRAEHDRHKTKLAIKIKLNCDALS